MQAERRNKSLQREIMNNTEPESASSKRARRLAREGARSKAVMGLQGGIRQLTFEQQHQWSAKLLPQSEHPFLISASQLPPPPPPEPRASTADRHPLKGVHFPPMTAPGPSLTRPEHISDMLSVRLKCVSNRLLRNIGQAVNRALDGTLPKAARWILGSGITFLEKPGKDTPRPIRAGEWLR